MCGCRSSRTDVQLVPTSDRQYELPVFRYLRPHQTLTPLSLPSHTTATNSNTHTQRLYIHPYFVQFIMRFSSLLSVTLLLVLVSCFMLTEARSLLPKHSRAVHHRPLNNRLAHVHKNRWNKASISRVPTEQYAPMYDVYDKFGSKIPYLTNAKLESIGKEFHSLVADGLRVVSKIDLEDEEEVQATGNEFGERVARLSELIKPATDYIEPFWKGASFLHLVHMSQQSDSEIDYEQAGRYFCTAFGLTEVAYEDLEVLGRVNILLVRMSLKQKPFGEVASQLAQNIVWM